MKILSHITLASFLVLAGCGETQTVITREGSRVEVRDASAEQCPDGGQVLLYGVDADGSGALEEAEIVSTHVLCDGADGSDGASSLIRAEPEPAGEHCAEGGVRILHGVDTDGSGELEDDEVQGEEYVCNGLPGSGLNSLVSVVEEAPGANCPQGGYAVLSGQDTSGDGLLQPAEVQGTVYVCHGQNGMTSLIRREDEPAGPNCPHGGQAVLTGVDGDGNGYLDDMEATATQYVCNGADGADGADGLDNLFETVPEPAGSTCPAGGIWVVSGPDGDRDGVLDPGEVQVEQVVCNGVDGVDGTDGADGRDSLVATSVVAPGAVCATGGVQVDGGLDADRDGVLDAGEVTTTRYLCNGLDGTDGVDGSDGFTTLVMVTAEPVGAHCANAGRKVESGLDVDRDGVLDAGEVTSTQYVCNGLDGVDGADGADGRDSLVATTVVTPGAVCATGGVQVESGLDADRDGVLDAGEVSATRVVCNGLDGADGADGLDALVATTVVTPGVVCATGGVKVESGLDADRDGVLDAGEVTSTQYVCNGLDGADGADGADGGIRLLRATNALWGGVCAYGGVKLEQGIDDNGDGVLGDPEVDTTQYVCNKADAILLLANGFGHNCLLKTNGIPWCWGANGLGQLGIGSLAEGASVPVPVQTRITGLARIITGMFHSCALTGSGAVYCWGKGGEGQLGQGNFNDQTGVYNAVVGVSSAVEMAAGHSHNCVVKSDGTVWCWGQNTYGQLGNGLTSNSNVAVQVAGLTGASVVALGWDSSCALKSDGTVWCWGRNNNGQLGNGTTTNSLVPVQAGSATTNTRISAGAYHVCTKRGLTVTCWGQNNYGQLGDGTTISRSSPTAVNSSSWFSEVSCSYSHTCSLLLGGNVACWGRNNYGQLGDGSTTNRSTPVPAVAGYIFTQVSAGNGHSCGLKSDGAAWCWGDNGSSLLGDGTGVSSLVPVQVDPGELAP